MANTITTQVIVDGSRNTIIKVFIIGDGSGEETNTVVFDASAYKTASTSNKLRKTCYNLNGFEAVLNWDATANVPLITLGQGHQEQIDFFRYGGGLPNNGGAGRTGDILMTTTGLGAGDEGYIIFYINQREVPKER
jgi:hypothetical protein